MRYGRSVPEGSLPVFSVDTEEQAKTLLTLTCQTNLDNEYVAEELAGEQTFENRQAFSRRLEKGWKVMKT